MLYGDGTIAQAISVLSAIEGIKLYAPQAQRFVVPLTVVVLVLLFAIQRKGTSWIGAIFGPIMLVWFVVIGILGIVGIAKAPAILAALSPLPAIIYLLHAGPLVLAVIGGAFLAVTGGGHSMRTWAISVRFLLKSAYLLACVIAQCSQGEDVDAI